MRVLESDGGQATLEVVVSHPGADPALMQIVATIDGAAVLDESVVVQPGDERTLLFPIAAAPDGTRMNVSTTWNNETIDDRVLTFGASEDGPLGRTSVLIAAALIIGVTGSGLIRAGRHRAEGSMA